MIGLTNTDVYFVEGQITPGSYKENTRALLDVTEDELASVDCISILQPQLCKERGNLTLTKYSILQTECHIALLIQF